MITSKHAIMRRIRFNIALVIVALAVSGITAYPLFSEIGLMNRHLNEFPGLVQPWLNSVYLAMNDVNTHHPFLNYGTDWLAFAHLMLAVLFAGPFKHPVQNKWVIQFGLLACLLVIPEALIAGHIRGVPWFWQLADCCFGIIGIIPMYLAYEGVLRLEEIEAEL